MELKKHYMRLRPPLFRTDNPLAVVDINVQVDDSLNTEQKQMVLDSFQSFCLGFYGVLARKMNMPDYRR